MHSYTLIWAACIPRRSLPSMGKKRVLITVVGLALLGILVYSQVKEWRDFDWATFWAETHRIRKIHILHGIFFIYVAYALRALRWQIFLQPLKKTSWLKLLPPTLIGFTGLALLGRPGEFIRPYLISRQENLPLTSQIAVWIVERAFDLGAFFALMMWALLVDRSLRWKLESFVVPAFLLRLHQSQMYLAGHLSVLLLLVVAAALATVLALRRLSAPFKQRLADKAREFRMGLNTIRGAWAFVQLAVVSLVMWYTIAVAYREVTHSYGVDVLRHMTTSHVLVLMGSSMVGSMVQLPAVGGGSQVATIGVLIKFFEVKKELAISCGILLWVVTFMAVIPLGLALAHRAHLSLRELSVESSNEEAAAVAKT